MSIQFDREKFKDVVHYVCAQCPSDRLGAVKLHKVLYFADMLHYALIGTPITGATYRKRSLGPTADYLLPALEQLAAAGRIEVGESDYFGYRKKRYVSRRAPDLERLGDTELALVNDVVEFVCQNNSAKTISEFSHNRAWDLAEFGGPLPYHSAFHLFPMQVSEDALAWAGQEAQRLEAEGDKRPQMERRSFDAFRKRVLAEREEHSRRP